MEDTAVRTADSIYSDRINLWHRLRELEGIVEGRDVTDGGVLEEIVEKSIRLELCFSELKKFNDTGTFIGRHPFIKERSERTRIAELLRRDPDKYFEERKNIELNITRYASQINGKASSEEKKQKAAENLERYRTILMMYKEVFNDFVK